MAAEPTIDQVKDCILQERARIGFPAAIENLFQQHLATYRAKALGTGIVPVLAIFNLFLLLEAVLFPSTLDAAITMHVVISAWIVLVGFGLRRGLRPVVLEGLAISIPLVTILYIMTMFSLHTENAREHEHYLAIAVLIYMNVNVRPAFGVALITSILVAAGYALALVVGGASLPACAVGVSFMCAAVYVSLLANWRMGRDARRAFLRRLLERLLRKEAEQQAGRDPLTGLGNRRRIEMGAGAIWAGQATSDESVAVVMVDVDHFKAFNDQFGHLEGDRCLRQVAEAIGGQLRDRLDIAGRFGGEEFILLLPRSDRMDGMRVAERVRVAVEQLAIPNASGSLPVTVSVGVAAGPISVHSFEELVQAADTALYAAKRDGRNRVWPPFGLLSETIDRRRVGGRR